METNDFKERLIQAVCDGKITQEQAEYLMPELKKCEDERIKEAIKSLIIASEKMELLTVL
jgi:hypothetical protein